VVSYHKGHRCEDGLRIVGQHYAERFRNESTMPYLQLDVSHHYPSEVKRRFAQRLGHLFADVMQMTPDKVVIAFREFGEGSLWRCGAGQPEPAAVLKCDIRRGARPNSALG
jgi:phenylpyruvate tautomerase PptA (4-oxalocrotonate tautomerase family)